MTNRIGSESFKFLVFILVLFCGFQNTTAQVAKELRIENKSEQKTVDKDELLKKYHLLTNEPRLLSRGLNTVYKGDNLSAIQFPVGGIGTGCIQYDGNAVPRYWQIFNNMGHDFIPNSFFAIRVKNQNETKVRALQTKDVGSFTGMKALEAEATFPFLKYTFKDELAANIIMEVYNPFIPTNLKDSGISAVFYQFTIENPTKNEIKVSLLGSQQNAVGFSKLPIKNGEKSFADNYDISINRNAISGNNSVYYGGNKNTIITENGAKMLLMEGDMETAQEHFGQMALLLFNDSDGIINDSDGITSWRDEKQLFENFKKKGRLKGKQALDKSKEGETYTGALNTSFKLKPGEKRVVKMALAWYFPNGKNGGFMDKWDAWGKGDWEGDGNNYSNHWENIEELTKYITNNHQELIQDSRLFSKTFYGTNLPHWLMERLGNQLSILKSRTIFHDKNGYIGLWEGVGGVDGSCAGNCNHVWHYAQSHARLFPEMGKAIRNQTFNYIKDDGQIPYRQPLGTPAFDGQCGDILGAYREHLLSSDNRWLESQYSAIKRSMNYLIEKHDSDKDGWLSDKRKHTTYDASMTGNPSFLSSLYLAALKACEKMAIAVSDTEQATEWGAIAINSSKLQSEKLWNGEYFYQIPGEKRATDYETACHSDQLLGQWWADQLGLGSLYPDYKIKKATESILKYNFKSTLENYDQGHRTFALPDEAAMVVSTWPNNDRTDYASGYSSEVWTTFEYTIGASLIKYGKVQDALTILRSGYHRYDGKLRTGYIGDWGNFGFSGNPFGDDECGQFYGRALSIWSVLLAAQGYGYNGPEQSIAFNPKWKPENHNSFFSTAEGWGSFSQFRKELRQENSIDLKYGKLSISQIILTVENDEYKNASLKLNGKEIKVDFDINNGNATVNFNAVDLVAGDNIEIKLN